MNLWGRKWSPCPIPPPSSILEILSFLLFTRLSVQFSHSVMSDFLRPHGLQHSRLPCPSPTPRARSNSCPSSRWCHPTISSPVIPFFSFLQSFTASRSFLVSQLFVSGGQSIGASAPSSEYSGLVSFRMDWFDLAVQGTLKSLLQHQASPTPGHQVTLIMAIVGYRIESFWKHQGLLC